MDSANGRTVGRLGRAARGGVGDRARARLTVHAETRTTAGAAETAGSVLSGSTVRSAILSIRTASKIFECCGGGGSSHRSHRGF